MYHKAHSRSNNHAVEFLEHAIQIIRNVVSRIPYMTGIEANPQMAVELDAVDDGRQFLGVRPTSLPFLPWFPTKAWWFARVPTRYSGPRQ